MIRILTTAEASERTGLTTSSVRRRLDTDLAPRVTIQNGTKTTFAVTEDAVKNFVATNRSKKN